jgi:hypothetical protein
VVSSPLRSVTGSEIESGASPTIASYNGSAVNNWPSCGLVWKCPFKVPHQFSVGTAQVPSKTP